jgi:hypothetical protein
VQQIDERQTIQENSASSTLTMWEPDEAKRNRLIGDWNTSLHDIQTLENLRDTWGANFDAEFVTVLSRHLVQSRAAIQSMLDTGDIMASRDMLEQTLASIDDNLVLLAQLSASLSAKS